MVSSSFPWHRQPAVVTVLVDDLHLLQWSFLADSAQQLYRFSNTIYPVVSGLRRQEWHREREDGR